MSTRAIQLGIFQSGFRDPSTDIALIGGAAEFYVADGNFTTPKNAYEDIQKASVITSVTLDAFGQYPTGLYFDGSQIYDIRIKDSVGTVKYNLTSVKIPANTQNTRTVTAASVIATIDDDVILADTSGNAITVTLYPVGDSINPIQIKNIGATGNDVTVAGDGSDLIDGVATQTLTPAQGQEYFSDGASWYGAGNINLIVTASGVTDGTIILKQKVIEIGVWDITSTPTRLVTHGLSPNGVAKIRSVSVVIRNDVGSFSFPLPQDADGYAIIDATDIQISVTGGGFFDSVDFDSTSISRGWITIWYED